MKLRLKPNIILGARLSGPSIAQAGANASIGIGAKLSGISMVVAMSDISISLRISRPFDADPDVFTKIEFTTNDPSSSITVTVS